MKWTDFTQLIGQSTELTDCAGIKKHCSLNKVTLKIQVVYSCKKRFLS